MPRAPFQQELYKWLRKHVQAGDIPRDMANHIFYVVAKDFPGSMAPRAVGRPRGKDYAIMLPGLDFEHNDHYRQEIIGNYLFVNSGMDDTPTALARFATVLRETGCLVKNADKKSILSNLNEFRKIFDKLDSIPDIKYNSFAQALKNIDDVEGSYPRNVREQDISKFKEYMTNEVERVSKIPIVDDVPEF